MGQTTQLGPPNLSHQPAQHRAAGEAEETRETQSLIWCPLPSCPRWQGAQHPSGARSGGESLVPGTAVGRLPAAHLKGLSADSCIGQRMAPSPALSPAARGPPGPRRPLRHEMRPLDLPRDLFTEAELDWHAFLKDSQSLLIEL